MNLIKTCCIYAGLFYSFGIFSAVYYAEQRHEPLSLFFQNLSGADLSVWIEGVSMPRDISAADKRVIYVGKIGPGQQFIYRYKHYQYKKHFEDFIGIKGDAVLLQLMTKPSMTRGWQFVDNVYQEKKVTSLEKAIENITDILNENKPIKNPELIPSQLMLSGMSEETAKNVYYALIHYNKVAESLTKAGAQESKENADQLNHMVYAVKNEILKNF